MMKVTHTCFKTSCVLKTPVLICQEKINTSAFLTFETGWLSIQGCKFIGKHK